MDARVPSEYVNLVELAQPMMVMGKDGAPLDLLEGSLVIMDPDTGGVLYHWARTWPLERPSPPPRHCTECRIVVSSQSRTGLCHRCRMRLYMRRYRRKDAAPCSNPS